MQKISKKCKLHPKKKLHPSESLPWEPIKSPWWQNWTSNQCFKFGRENSFLTTVKKGTKRNFTFFNFRAWLLNIFSLEAPFISSGGARGNKASKKMPFFNSKIIRYLCGGYYKKCKFFRKWCPWWQSENPDSIFGWRS